MGGPVGKDYLVVSAGIHLGSYHVVPACFRYSS